MAADEIAPSGADLDKEYRHHNNSHSPDVDEGMSDPSEFGQYSSDASSASLRGHLPPAESRSAPSPDQVSNSLRTSSWDETKNIGSLSNCLTSSNHRASSPKLTAYDGKHENIDCHHVIDPHLRQRLEAMRARNAEDRYHNQLPPEDAPAHIQMMVLLYQWAAWAFETPDQAMSERLIKWVNGRIIAFMMSGGRLPGYNLKELLVIAGVDPKELYGLADEPGEQGKLMANMSSSQIAATIGEKQAEETQHRSKMETDLRRGIYVSSTAHGDAVLAPITTTNKRGINECDEDDLDNANERDAVTQRVDAINNEGVCRKHGSAVLTPASAIAYNEPADVEKDGEKAGPSNRRDDVQDSKRQKLDAEGPGEAPSPIDNVSVNMSRTTSPAHQRSPDPAVKERYLQTFFKAQINAVFKSHGKSSIRKNISKWSDLERRLHNTRLSVNIIRTLRDDYENGWKTWDGTSFFKLRDSLKSKEDKVTAESAPTKFTLAPPKPVGVATSLTKSGNTPKASKKRNPEASYDSADGEWTAAKTSSRAANTEPPPPPNPRPVDTERDAVAAAAAAAAVVVIASANASPEPTTTTTTTTTTPSPSVTVLAPHDPFGADNLHQHIFRYRALHFRFHPHASRAQCLDVLSSHIVARVDGAILSKVKKQLNMEDKNEKTRTRTRTMARPGRYEEFWLGYQIVAQGYWAEGEGDGEGEALAWPMAGAGRWLWDRK